jgi:hypothetical protein
MSAIGTAKQNSPNQVYVYDEKGSYKFSLNGELVGYTGSTVTVKPNPSSSQIYVYDENGHYKFSK